MLIADKHIEFILILLLLSTMWPLVDVTCFPYSLSHCLTLLASLILYRIV